MIIPIFVKTNFFLLLPCRNKQRCLPLTCLSINCSFVVKQKAKKLGITIISCVVQSCPIIFTFSIDVGAQFSATFVSQFKAFFSLVNLSHEQKFLIDSMFLCPDIACTSCGGSYLLLGGIILLPCIWCARTLTAAV